MPHTVIKLVVHNHPGVMSQVTGLFARRAYNLEGILCGPLGEGRLSRVYLLLDAGKPVSQLVRQLAKLYDVVEVSEDIGFDTALFCKLDELTDSTGNTY